MVRAASRSRCNAGRPADGARPAIVLQRVPVAKWLGVNVVLWGIATACTAAAKNYHGLLVARIFLGIFEAAIAPSLMLIGSMYYTKSEQAPRFSLWYCGLGVGQIIGGIVSFAFQKVHNPSFHGWRVMFIVLGLVTVLIGLATIFLLPDTPMKARFLSEAEKVALLRHVSVNETGISNKHYKLSHILEAVMDLQLWLMTILTILVSEIVLTRKLISRGWSNPMADEGGDFFFPFYDADLHLQRCRDNILGHIDQEFWLQFACVGAAEHAIRRRQHRFDVDRRLWRASDIESMGLARGLLYSRHPGRGTPVVSAAPQTSTIGGYLPGQLHRRHVDHHLSVDGVQLRRSY